MKKNTALAHQWLWKLRFRKEREWETWGGAGAVEWGGVLGGVKSRAEEDGKWEILKVAVY